MQIEPETDPSEKHCSSLVILIDIRLSRIRIQTIYSKFLECPIYVRGFGWDDMFPSPLPNDGLVFVEPASLKSFSFHFPLNKCYQPK